MHGDRLRFVLVAAATKPSPDLPPQLQHVYLETSRRHRVDAVRRCIHGADLQRVLIFMNYQQTLQVMHMLPLAGISVSAHATHVQLVCGILTFTNRQPTSWVSCPTDAT